MTETLSTQLCKSAGIEPKIGICDRQLRPEDYAGECGFVNPTDFECSDCNNFIADLMLFPDFESDTDNARFNFLKLVQIISVEIHFDGNIKNYLKSLKPYIGKLDNELKQILQNTDWRY